MEFRFFALIIFLSGSVFGQSPRVPSKLQFADLKLRIMEDARREIQADVDALTRSPHYFEIKAEKARSYFPIIERVFREENVPEDFKYLVIQESALVADAVSSSNAVGFWQFKDFTALEMGLRVDKQVDERMNIVSASRGACRYLKRNNNRYFDNWLITLMAYQMGEGAAIKAGGEKHRGAKSMVINKKTYWYIKKYLAHRIAFEGVKNKPTKIPLTEYTLGANKTFKEISQEIKVEEDVIKEYNKWLKKGRIPQDRPYVVVVPGEYNELLTSGKIKSRSGAPLVKIKAQVKDYPIADEKAYPKIDNAKEYRAGTITKINGLPGIVAGPKNRIADLAAMANIDLKKFLKYNDLDIDDKLIPGEVYYLKNKRTKAQEYYHVLLEDENLWSVSQKYAVRLSKLEAKNRIKKGEKIKTGRVLWLRFIRPTNTAVEYKNQKEKEETKPVIQKTENVVAKSQDQPSTIQEGKSETADSQPEIRTEKTFLEKLDSLENVEKQPTGKVADNYTKTEEKVKQQNETKISPPPSEGSEKVIVEPAREVTEVNDEPSELQKVMHTITAGQTYYALSKMYGVGVLEILEWNNLKISDKLSIGQELVIYVKSNSTSVDNTQPSGFISYTVSQGDTLSRIARNHHVSVKDIMVWNNKSDTQIKFGEVLKIKKAAR